MSYECRLEIYVDPKNGYQEYSGKCDIHHKIFEVCETGLQQRIEKERKEAVKEFIETLSVKEIAEMLNWTHKPLVRDIKFAVFIDRLLTALKRRAGLDEEEVK